MMGLFIVKIMIQSLYCILLVQEGKSISALLFQTIVQRLLSSLFACGIDPKIGHAEYALTCWLLKCR
jgi:hypothetical protein